MNKQITGAGTVGKALEIIDAIATLDHPARFSDIQQKCNYPKATLYRFLQILTTQGMLRYNDETHCYSVGLRLVEMAHKAWQQSSLAPIAAPILINLSKEVEETVHLAQMETGQVLFVDKYRTSDRFETLAQAGRVAPAHCTGVGKAILAFLSERRFNVAMSRQSFNSFTPMTHLNAETLMEELEEIRLDGIAYDREEHEQGIISIAAPILTTKKRVIGAISIATTTNRHNLESIKKFKPILMESTKSIGEAATAWQFPQTQ